MLRVGDAGIIRVCTYAYVCVGMFMCECGVLGEWESAFISPSLCEHTWWCTVGWASFIDWLWLMVKVCCINVYLVTSPPKKTHTLTQTEQMWPCDRLTTTLFGTSVLCCTNGLLFVCIFPFFQRTRSVSSCRFTSGLIRRGLIVLFYIFPTDSSIWPFDRCCSGSAVIYASVNDVVTEQRKMGTVTNLLR